MQTLFLVTGILLGCGLAWWAGKSYDRSQKKSMIRDLESRLRFSQGESLKLKEKVATMKGEVVSLQKNLNDQKLHHAEQLTTLGTSFKKGVLALGVCYFAVGITLGGVGAWFSATIQTEAKNIVEKAQLDFDARVAIEKAEYYKQKASGLTKDLKNMEEKFRALSVDKEVLVAKFRILLASMSPNQTLDGFGLDYSRLKKSLKNETRDQDAAIELPVLNMIKL